MYLLDIENMLTIDKIYTVTRNTIWKIADPYNILFCVLDGKCKIITNGKEYLLKKNDIMFIPGNQLYERYPIDDEMCKMLYVHFSTKKEILEIRNDEAIHKVSTLQSEIEEILINSENNSKLTSLQFKNIYIKTLNNNKNTFTILKEIENRLTQFSPENISIYTLYICQILLLLSEDIINLLKTKNILINNDNMMPKVLKNSILYIRQNCTKEILLDDLCLNCNISKSQLNRYFKSFLKTTPTQYILIYKINRAKQLLVSSNELSIKSIALNLGFEDQHYFSRLFKKITNETPTEYIYRVKNFKG